MATSREVSSFRLQDSRDSVRVEQVMVAVHDTVMVTKTITITKNVDGDTTFTSVVMERDRVRDRAQVKEKEERVVVKTDTVFIEKRDSVEVRNHSPTSGAGSSGGFVASLRWVFWIIIGLIGLVICLKFKGIGSR